MQISIAEATDLAVRALTRAGLKQEAARIVADHLVDANLCGHEFSSLPRVLAIADELRKKPPPGEIRVVREDRSSAVIDGGDNIAYVVSLAAIDKAMEICRQHGVAVVAAHNTWFSGRCAFYVERAAREGFVAMHTTNTTARVAPYGGIDRLILGTGTATGEAIYTALDALAAANDTAGAAATSQGGSAMVLLSDGVPTVGRPVLGAAQDAADRGVPISTIAFGTADGTVTVQGRLVSVPADPDTMASVAEITSGKFFKAVSAKELRSVYKDIGTRVGYETEQHDASGPIITLAVVALLVASGLALMWNGRLV